MAADQRDFAIGTEVVRIRQDIIDDRRVFALLQQGPAERRQDEPVIGAERLGQPEIVFGRFGIAQPDLNDTDQDAGGQMARILGQGIPELQIRPGIVTLVVPAERVLIELGDLGAGRHTEDGRDGKARGKRGHTTRQAAPHHRQHCHPRHCTHSFRPFARTRQPAGFPGRIRRENPPRSMDYHSGTVSFQYSLLPLNKMETATRQTRPHRATGPPQFLSFHRANSAYVLPRRLP